MSDRVDRLRERLEAGNPESWQPSMAGDEIIGTFVRVSVGHTAFGPSPIVVLTDEDGVEKSVWLLHTVLRNQMNRLRPALGELVGIRYLGKREPVGGGSEYDDYRVVVDRDSLGIVNWDELLGVDHDSLHPPIREQDVPEHDDAGFPFE